MGLSNNTLLNFEADPLELKGEGVQMGCVNAPPCIIAYEREGDR